MAALWDTEPLAIFDARQAMRIGAYKEAQAAITRLPKNFARAEEAIILQLEIFDAQGDFLHLDKFVVGLLEEYDQLRPVMLDLLKLVQARCRMMTDLAMSDYLTAGIATWNRALTSVNLVTCDRTTVSDFVRPDHTLAN